MELANSYIARLMTAQDVELLSRELEYRRIAAERAAESPEAQRHHGWSSMLVRLHRGAGVRPAH